MVWFISTLSNPSSNILLYTALLPRWASFCVLNVPIPSFPWSLYIYCLFVQNIFPSALSMATFSVYTLCIQSGFPVFSSSPPCLLHSWYLSQCVIIIFVYWFIFCPIFLEGFPINSIWKGEEKEQTNHSSKKIHNTLYLFITQSIWSIRNQNISYFILRYQK